MSNELRNGKEIIKVDVKNLTKKFGDLLVLDNVSFHVKDGEFLCIVGPTGCGKTVFLNTLSKIYDATSGEILIDDKAADPKRQHISYVFQENSTIPWLTVRENISFGLKIKGIDKQEIKRRVEYMLSLVCLEEYADYYPKQLSISMLQRVVIARAFAVRPDILLMDEPYGQLELELRFRLEDELIKISQREHTTILFITHNVEEAVYMADRVLVLTNKPTKIKEEVSITMEHPRDIASEEFIRIRNQVTDLIKWW